MMENGKSDNISKYTSENGGKVLLLFLLFLIALYQLITIGITGFAIVCMLPAVALYAIFAMRHKMITFWTLFVINYFVMFLNRYNYMPVPVSMPNEVLEIILLAIAIIDAKSLHLGRVANIMFFALVIWCGFCTIEVLNDTCDLGIDIASWFSGARLMAFQLMYAYLVCIIYISTPKRVTTFLRLWAALSLFAAFWAWKQQHIGFTSIEKAWLVYGARTHIVNGITRYFSIFSDAANLGCNMAASAVAFFIVSVSHKSICGKERIFFFITGLACTWTMFASGTRTAIFCFAFGVSIDVFLSKSFKIAIPVTIIFGFFMFILVFTTIGQGNSMIRRMRSAFNKEDASLGTREINQTAMKKYMQDAPWGIGISRNLGNVPANNKYRKVSVTAPDSEYVFIWVHTGVIGITTFIVTTMMMFLGACIIVFFKLRNKSLQGIGAAFCCAFAAIHLGGYGNQILMQFPNVLIFYGGLAVVYILPHIENEYDGLEKDIISKREERKRLIAEKQRASRD